MPASSFAAYVIQLVGNCSPDEDQAWPTVTPRILLSHTSSLANFAFLEPDRKMHLHAQPGKAYRYSGEGLNIVQFLIEQKTDRPLDQLMSEAIFNPLGMSRADMIDRRNLRPTSPIASMKTKSSCRRRRFPARASGNMTSSAEDLVRFASALLKPQVEIRTLHQFVFVESEPDGEEAACICLAYGMGWGLLTKTPTDPPFFKEGHGDGAQNHRICCERRKACMILLTHSDNGEFAFSTPARNHMRQYLHAPGSGKATHRSSLKPPARIDKSASCKKLSLFVLALRYLK